MFRFDASSPIHLAIAEFVAAFGGEPVEASAPALINWQSDALGWTNKLYHDHLENLREGLRLTGGQMILTESPGAWTLTSPFTGIYRNPPGGTFRRFTLSFRDLLA